MRKKQKLPYPYEKDRSGRGGKAGGRCGGGNKGEKIEGKDN